MSLELYSFDVFDTLISRTTATPKGIFALMQKKLLEEDLYADYPVRLKNNFYHLRIQSEAVARNTYITDTVKDIVLEQIYECLNLTVDLSEEQLSALMELEIQTEYGNSIPIHCNINKVKDLLVQGKKVILVSNMYLSAKVVKQLLVQADEVFSSIPVYVSGELGKTKGTQTLYYYVKQQEKIEFSQWKHYGDNRNLDVEIPVRLGMQAEWYEKPEPLPWEQEFLQQREENAALQLLIGASLNTRRNNIDNYSYTVGVGYSGVLFYPYVEWVLQESIKKGIKQLFFIARDGYVLKEIADIIISCKSLEIETHYLYGSRKAWRLPSITMDNFDMEDFLNWNYPGQIYSFEGLAEKFEMSVSELSRLLPFDAEENVEISKPILKEIFQILKDNQKEIALYIQEKQKKKRVSAVSYLKQEIEISKGQFAFVDLIGSGYTQKCLAELLQEWYEGSIQTFFYRLDSCRHYAKNKNYAYYPNRIKLGNIIEVLCGAAHGQTLGYEMKKDVWEPVLDRDEGQYLEAYGFQDYLQGIRDYTKEIVSGNKDVSLSVMDLSLPALYFDYMANARDMQLYGYIADMPYGIRGNNNEVKSFAPLLSDRDLRNIYLIHKGESVNKFYSGYSLEFSLLRLNEKQKRMVSSFQKWSNTGFFRWIYKNRNKRRKGRVYDSRYDLIGNKIILYGAGKRGQLLYRQLTERSGKYHSQIVLWLDKNEGLREKEGIKVYGLNKLSEPVDYDQIVIAVLNEKVAEEMKQELLKRKVPAYKILWIRPM